MLLASEHVKSTMGDLHFGVTLFSDHSFESLGSLHSSAEGPYIGFAQQPIVTAGDDLVSEVHLSSFDFLAARGRGGRVCWR